MIKFLLLLVFLALKFQDTIPQSTRISMAAHPQLTWLVPDNAEVTNEGVIMGINSGLIIDFFFAEKYAFSTGLTIDNLGGKISFGSDVEFNVTDTSFVLGSGDEFKQNLQYLGIPLGLKLKTQEIGYTTFYINPILTPSINLRSRAMGGDIPEKTDFSDETELFSLSYSISGGFEYSLGGSTSIFSGIGYSAGLLDLTKNPGYRITTRSVFLTLGILF